MKKVALLSFLSISFGLAPALADPVVVPVPVDEELTGIVFSGEVDLFSPGLTGTRLEGQDLSLALLFSDDILARLFLLSPTRLGIGLSVFTNAPSFPGLPGPTTGLLVDRHGVYRESTRQTAGRAQSDAGFFTMGLVSFTPDMFGESNVIGISGVHFDTIFPDTGFVVTNLRLRFTLRNNTITFGTAEQLPEPSTLVLLAVGLLPALLLRRR